MNARLSALRFVVGCLSVPNSGNTNEELRASIERGDVDWQHVRDLADGERIAPALWIAVRNRGLANALPPNVRGELWKIHLFNSLRNKRFREQALAVFRVLNAIGVRPMILKGGASLFDQTFEDPGSRVMVDLDLLVPRERAEECWATLRLQSYDPIAIDFDYSNHHHLRPLYRPGEQGTVEVHRELLPHPTALALARTLAWNHVQPREESGTLFGIPSPTIRVLHSILHSAVVDRAYARADLSLKSLFEIAALQRAFGGAIDWVAIQNAMAEHGLSEIISSWMYSMHRWFGDPIPYCVRPTIRSTLHFERTRLQARWRGSARVVDRLMSYSAESICKRYDCSNRFWPVLSGRLRLASKRFGRSLAQLSQGQPNQSESSSESAHASPTEPRNPRSDQRALDDPMRGSSGSTARKKCS